MKTKLVLYLFCFLFPVFWACDADWEYETPGNGDGNEEYEDDIDDAESENCEDHEQSSDYVWDDSDVIEIILNGSSITINGTGAFAEGSVATITSAGTYRITGTLNDGQIVVNTEDEEVVRLIFDNIDVYHSISAPIYVENAEKAVIILADNSENEISDGSSYVFEGTDDEPNAAIFSKSDLTIYGNGTLIVDGNYNDAIASKDGLVINSSTLDVTAIDDGIRGKDYLVVRTGDITIHAEGDGMKSDNDEDDDKGYISIEEGDIDITSGADALDAETDILITDADMTLYTGSGYNGSIGYGSSAKALKAGVNLIIETGTFSIDATDDALHSNGNLAVNGGDFNIETGDDGVHADYVVGIFGGALNIAACYEGIESNEITIDYGTIHIDASDDGINGVSNTSQTTGTTQPGQTQPGTGTSTSYLYINGGYIVIVSGGDGIDVGGSIQMTDGDVIIHGPTSNNDGAIDYDGSFAISGGFLIASGSSGMAEAPGTSSTQNSLLLILSSSYTANTLIHIETSGGSDILTFSPEKRYQSIAFSSPELVQGSTYKIYSGGSSTGTNMDGLYLDGTYNPGSEIKSFTVSSVVTKIGSSNTRP